MFKFNPDGSIKLPSGMQKEKDLEKSRLENQRCIKVRKDVVNTFSPKSCKLSINLSNKFTDNKFIENIYNQFRVSSQTPTKLKEISEKEFEVEVGTNFSRCKDCCNLVNRYREFLDGGVIEDKGTCTFKGRNSTFCEEDYFD
tara:strand:- start:440 stop:865 length:426 start_codon:yes stop_codon:yes gene_type:complete